MNKQEKIKLELLNELNDIDSETHGVKRDKQGHYYTKLLIAKHKWPCYVLASIFSVLGIWFYLNPQVEDADAVVKLSATISVLMIICILVLHYSRFIITVDTLIIRNLFSRKIPLEELKRVAAVRAPKEEGSLHQCIPINDRYTLM